MMTGTVRKKSVSAGCGEREPVHLQKDPSLILEVVSMLRAITWGLVLCLPLPPVLGQDQKDPPVKEDMVRTVGKGLTIEGKLTADDPKDALLKNSYQKVHLVKMEAGNTYVIDLRSNKFDSFLRLEDSAKKQLAQDDDGGGFPHARIVFPAKRTDAYRIIVTTFKGGDTGEYTLSIRQPSGVEKEFRNLEAAFQKQQQVLEKEFRAAANDQDRNKIRDRFFDMLADHMVKVGKFAEKNAADPVAQEATRKVLQVVQVLNNSDSPAIQKTLAAAEPILTKAANNAKGPEGKQIADILFTLQKLSVGKKAPEIEGEDLEGKKFKLSDYRGKVVSLVFWGSWCPPCRAMIPHERELVKKMQDRPFALLGVNSDRDKDKLKEFREKEMITWRSFWNGENGTAGPISAAYRVNSWPAIWVLDGDGVIRYRNVRGEAMERAVEALLKEMESKNK